MKNQDKVTKDKENTELKKQIEVLTNDWKRALADYQNLQRRYEKEKIEFAQYANGILVLKLLSTLDYLEKVQSYLKDDGLGLAIKEFKNVLSEEGLKEVEVLGKKFNPEEMEAIEKIDGEEDKVIEVISKGYRLKDKLIRPAKVKVSVIII
ncbi:nucleotide exchange factor GrpE [Candidatus Shapirobacteria bacterium CG03_land_8_20_14_0_80_40_19]|uniref:Protein GrpE n=4 Tax=Candidatus Shapironibacteriota TaxID=1752721 RepID=A0A2M7BFZ9_9BACT|nr:MAG: nucleotide exchange factor GrpE [Candidatus Shapirobacteria bacterium CG11_big_fil_rev_8_21_14_0_20_40_12]PIV02033.1 MAG: nucleotide exchange factor GrpE [Candidatus Shapirobacteria bacterium CG03_land_8_20_14_0_80_40_19]PJC29264.1 MAG: nucleotide exchange factor GrpE [Candidatus Shapirobacteria bacterium CG_4_9_14_0_2_um_filter_40_11]PJC76197.1 MAG: nucleotide exchange factor GrpE [Candidatus Shapirobacteria bacterium CG_4_8_14_3_um_filter_39_11]